MFATVESWTDRPLGQVPRWGLEEDATREAVAQRLFGRSRSRRIGRFELGERLGVGGMGEVWRAYDPKLERPVALKTVRGETVSRGPADRRLLDEARALARLRHPNVLAVHDVLEIDALVVIVMELAAGDNLRVWAERDEIGRGRILAALEAAARGLIAAHEAGVAHLDFKPTNVLIEDEVDERVLVADFGLAHRLGRSRTLTGGTPGYAAPEQWRARAEVDARTDQFAFASTVCALLGRGPALSEDDPNTLDDAAYARQVLSAVEATGLGRVQRRALLRALAREPEARWASMGALANALFVRPRARRRGLTLAVALAAALGLGGLLSRAVDGPPACAGVTAEAWLGEAWDLDQRQRFIAAAAELPGVVQGVGVAAGWLDARRRALMLEWPGVCEVSLLDHRDPGVLAQRRCVERRRVELVEVARLLAAPSPGMLERAPQIVAEMGAIEDCALAVHSKTLANAWSAEQLEARPRVLAAFAQAKVHRRAGDREAERRVLTGAQSIVETLGDPALIAELEQQRGMMTIEDGEIEAGLELVERAYFRAFEAGAEPLAADTANLLVFLTGAQARDPSRAHRWARHARAHFNKLGVGPTRSARLEAHLGAVRSTEGDNLASLAHYRRALDLLAEVDAPDLWMAALNGKAIALEGLGDPEAALATYTELESILGATYGRAHPRYGVLANNIGAALQASGAFEDALAHHQHAHAVAEDQGFERLQLSALTNLCFAHNSAGHPARGLDDCQAAVRVCLALFATSDDRAMRCSDTNMALGNTLAKLGRGPEALAAYQAVFGAYVATYEPEDPTMAWAYSSLGAGHVAVEDWAAAREAYAQALVLARVGAFPAAEIAEVQFGLGRAVHALGEHERGLALAREALRGYAEAGYAEAEAGVEAFLRERSPPS